MDGQLVVSLISDFQTTWGRAPDCFASTGWSGRVLIQQPAHRFILTARILETKPRS